MQPASGAVFFLALRRLRAPLITLILIYAVAITGLVAIPGRDAAGQAAHLSFFHAFYFVTYTATTIGFGELPLAFTDTQRFWVTICIYLLVFGWSYALLMLLALFQDTAFQQARVAARFRREVARLGESFYLVCGAGETGLQLCRSLMRQGRRVVAIDSDPARIGALELEDFPADLPALAADAANPETLVMAGLCHVRCRGVAALTNDDQVNLAVAISVRLLNPSVPVLARAEAAETSANMASFDTTHILNPFDAFGEHLALSIKAPSTARLVEWLTDQPGVTLDDDRSPPAGFWVVCGYGRFGRAVASQLERLGLDFSIIDPRSDGVDGNHRWVHGQGTEAEPLSEAGVERAVGLVAGSDNDVNNLSIAVTAKALNPSLFVVLRQNHRANRRLFDAFGAEETVVPSEIIALEALARITTPLLADFLAEVRRQDDAWAAVVIKRLERALGSPVPVLWSFRINVSDAPALRRHLMNGEGDLPLETLLRDTVDRTQRLHGVVLLLKRDDEVRVLPEDDELLAPGDEVLFAGTQTTRLRQELLCRNQNVLAYVAGGVSPSSGWLGHWWQARQEMREVKNVQAGASRRG